MCACFALKMMSCLSIVLPTVAYDRYQDRVYDSLEDLAQKNGGQRVEPRK